MKRMLAVIMTVIIALCALGLTGASAETMYKKAKTMYVVTEDGKVLNVRSEPKIREGNVITQLQYGTKVTVLGEVSKKSDWVIIKSKKTSDGKAYVMRRFLSANEPQQSKKQIEDAERLKNLEELNRQIATYKALDKQLMLVARPSRTSGWVNFRTGPGVAANAIGTLPDGRELTAIGETAKWYHAIDSATGKTGYVSKQYVNVVGTVEEQPVEIVKNEKESLGRLNVNGEFALECKLPEGYEIQVVNMRNTKIVASVTSKDETKPVMYLSIAYDEMYSGVDRLNDLNADDLKALEDTFTEINDVEITYRETGYGTKLMVVRERGNDTDFVDIFTVYKGYDVEFNVTPGAGAAELTDEQIKTSIAFLTDLDFVEVK